MAVGREVGCCAGEDSCGDAGCAVSEAGWTVTAGGDIGTHAASTMANPTQTGMVFAWLPPSRTDDQMPVEMSLGFGPNARFGYLCR